jgi:phosphoribosylamine--glycine ligase
MTKVVVVGSGGREHALADVISRDADVVVTPGNPAIPNSIPTSPLEIDADLYVIGPEAPLVDGLADQLREQGKLVFGPGADGAQLEGSKAWMKDLVMEAGVPTADHGTFTDANLAQSFLETMAAPYVIKTDGLAAGKGVLVTDSLDDAKIAVNEYLSGTAFGGAGEKIVIEEGLVGPEISILAISDGKKAVALSPAQDFKRLHNNDFGPNTGGMGAYSPVPIATPSLVDDVLNNFIQPTITELRRRGIDYRGVLYAGLMITEGGPKLLEYNVRFGDPEAQVVLPRFESSLTDLLLEASRGDIRTTPVFTSDAMVTVVCASEGYPSSPRVGDRIRGMEEATNTGGVEKVYAAGIKLDEEQQPVTAGGRVLAVTGRGNTIEEARQNAYTGAGKIHWEGLHKREDIAEAIK